MLGFEYAFPKFTRQSQPTALKVMAFGGGAFGV